MPLIADESPAPLPMPDTASALPLPGTTEIVPTESAASPSSPSGLTTTASVDLRPMSPPLSDSGTSSSSASATAPDPAPEGASAPASPSQNVTINLINLMVKRGLITKEDSANLIRQANDEAEAAKAQAAATQAASDRAAQAAQTATAAAASVPSSPTPATPVGDDDVRVTYVPDVVKQQMTEQIKSDVMKEARDEHWAAPNSTPEWVTRFHVTGDIRTRYEGQFFPSGNSVGSFTNFNAINTGSGLNVNTLTPVLPQFNVDQDRNRFRLRARIGADIDLGQGFTAGMRIATGSDDSPVTENQTLGAANSGQGGNFGKYQIWLDRAFIKYDLWGQPEKDLSFAVGRFDNPFFHTSMIWADDLGFDGAVVKAKYKVTDGVTPFVTAGAFPVFNTDFNFSTNQSSKFTSEDKWLYAIQGGTSWTLNQDFSTKVAGAFYDFESIQGQVSSPIPVASNNEAGNTDDSRPSFAQNGNTYIALRDYTDPNPGTTPEIQYYGLAGAFREAVFTGQLDFSRFDPFHMALLGECVKNVAFDRNAILNGGPASNPGPQNNTTGASINSFYGGDMGYMVKLNMGKPVLAQLWDWNISASYRYVQTDATVDGFTDADFGGSLTGTNLKGYTIGGNVALSPRVYAGLVWMSADAVAGPTYQNDLIQLDLNAKF